MNILIICGHGGTPYDPGAVGNGYKEAELTREQGTLLKAEFAKMQGVTPILYDQSKDAFKILKHGGSLPLTYVDYVIELHFNAGVNDAGGNGRITGTEVLVHATESRTGVEQAILKHIAALGFVNRGVKRRSDLLVMNTIKRKGISPCLIETCFIDDKDDMTLYAQKKQAIIKAIAKGVAEGFGLTYTTVQEETKMTQEQITVAINAAMDKRNPIYNTLDAVPDWGKPTMQKLIDSGVYKGTSSGLNLSYEMLRIFVVNDRADIYGE